MSVNKRQVRIRIPGAAGLRLVAPFLGASCLFLSPVQAQTVTWSEPTGNPADFATGSNWQGGSAPTAVDEAVFNQAGTQSPTISSAEATSSVFHGTGDLNLQINNGSLDTGLVNLASGHNNTSTLSVGGTHSPNGFDEAAALRLTELNVGIGSGPGTLVTSNVDIDVFDGGYMGFTSSFTSSNLRAQDQGSFALDVSGSNATTGAKSTLDLGFNNQFNLGASGTGTANILISSGAELLGSGSGLGVGTTVDQSAGNGTLTVSNESTATLQFLNVGQDAQSTGTALVSNSDATVGLLSLAASTGSVAITDVSGTHNMHGFTSNSLLTINDLWTGTNNGGSYDTGTSALSATNGGAIQFSGSFKDEDLGATHGEHFNLAARGTDSGSGYASYIDFGDNNTYSFTGVGTGTARFDIEDGATIFGTNTVLNIGDTLGNDAGSASMNVRNGSTVGIDNVNLGNQTGSSGTLNIDNAGMTVQNLGLTTGGYLSSANINISGSYDGGGYQEAATLNVSNLTTGGTDQSGIFSVGSSDIQVTDGGAFNFLGSFQDNDLRADFNESFNLSVDGIGQTSGYNSYLNLGDNNTFNLGGISTGTATINVTNSATLDGSQNAVVNLGTTFSDGETGNGTLNVGSSGSVNLSALTLGQTGQGNLNVTGAGSVHADTLQLTGTYNANANITLSGDTLDGFGIPSVSRLTVGSLTMGDLDQFGSFSTGSTHIQVLDGAELGFNGSFQNTDLRADFNESFNMTVSGTGQNSGYNSYVNLGDNNTYNLGGIQTGTAALNVTNSGYVDGSLGTVLNVGTTFVDSQTGNGIVNVSDFGSLQLSAMSLGQTGSGTLNVTDGGNTHVNSLQLSGGANTSANITVSGGVFDGNLTPTPASLSFGSLTLGGFDQFGTFSTGSTDIQVSDGGQMSFTGSFQNIDLRADWGESFSMTADGVNQNIGYASFINLGDNNTFNLGGIQTGTATLNVNNGAHIGDNSSNGTLNVGTRFSDGQSGDATVNVDGGGQLFVTSLNLGAHDNSTGNLNVTNGGQVELQSQTLGIGQNANSTTTVAGSGSSLITNELNVAKLDNSGGTATGDHDVAVSNGGSLTVQNNADLHSASGQSTTVTVTGINSQATFGSNTGHMLNVSGLGSSTLNVADGAQVNLNGSLLVGNEAGSSGTVNLTGANSRIYGTDVILGAMGIGNLNVGSGATLDVNSLTVGLGGTLSGTGTVDANLFMDGQFNPGNSPGQLDIIGDVTLNSTATTIIELGGLTQGTEYDFINVDGNVTLGGILQFVFVDNFIPSLGDAFSFLSATGTLAGAFSSIVIDAVAGVVFNVSQDAFGSLILSADNDNPVPVPGIMALMMLGLLLGRRSMTFNAWGSTESRLQ